MNEVADNNLWKKLKINSCALNGDDKEIFTKHQSKSLEEIDSIFINSHGSIGWKIRNLDKMAIALNININVVKI